MGLYLWVEYESGSLGRTKMMILPQDLGCVLVLVTLLATAASIVEAFTGSAFRASYGSLSVPGALRGGEATIALTISDSEMGASRISLCSSESLRSRFFIKLSSVGWCTFFSLYKSP